MEITTSKKMMNPQKVWSVVGLFIIMLVISMPFYSAQAMAASVQITKNAGEQNIPRYLDAQGDAWVVEATITGSGVDTINPADVTIKIGNNEASFTSCSPGTLGIVCEYISPLTDGIQEAEYAFQVIYHFLNQVGVPGLVSNGDVIRSDGSAPLIVISHLQQNAQGQVEIDFTVNDKVRQGAPAVGIDTIEIVDADTGTVVQTITLPEIGKEQFNYRNDGGFSGILQASLAGQGLKRIKVRAVDWLGHESSAPVRTFRADFVDPVIKDNLNFTDFGRFVGDFVTSTDITVDIEESSVPTVIATSSLANLQGSEANCLEDTDTIGLWHCTWPNVEVNPQQDSISVTVTARDEFGNMAERTLTKTFTRDSSAPIVEFFGTERIFEDKSYVHRGRQRIILKVNEQGAGISAAGIRANLLALGRSNSEAPTECVDISSGIECYWDTSANVGDGVIRIGLSTFEDHVGNLGLSTEAELVVDNSGPKVEKIELFGGDKDYVQSNDQLKVRVRAIESSGMVILVNVNDVVMDAETTFPETHYTRNLVPTTGWQVFTDDMCEKVDDGAWNCEVFTNPVRSGPEQNMQIDVRVQDTAGNDASEWPEEAKNAELRAQHSGSATLTFDLLGLSLEDNPDYWEVARIAAMGGSSNFIDLDVTALTFTRLPFEVRLNRANNNVEMVSVDLQGCAPPEQTAGVSTAPPGGELPPEEGEQEVSVAQIPVISRSLLYAGVSAEGEDAPVPKIVLEFEPFDGKEMFNLPEMGGEHFTTKNVDYVCKFRIFSAVDGNALANPELQEVTVSVPFGYSVLGAADARLEELIAEEREAASTGFWGVIGTLEKVIKWLRYIASVITTVYGLLGIIEGPSKTALEPLGKNPITSSAAIATCLGLNSVTQGVHKGIDILSTPLAILSCKTPSGISWYDSWAGAIPAYYNQLMNIEVLQSPDFRGLTSNANGQKVPLQSAWKPARSNYDNLYLSAASFCVPGLVHNLDKYRQIKCRKIYCLENEVKANVATVSTCNELEGLLTCKYFIGELWYILPFSQLYDGVIGLLRSALRDPIALLHTGTIVVCGAHCLYSQQLSGTCNNIYWLWGVIDWIEGTVAFIFTIVDDLESGGLNYCDSVL